MDTAFSRRTAKANQFERIGKIKTYLSKVKLRPQFSISSEDG